MKKEKGYKIQEQILRIVPESCIWIIEVPEETEANNQKWEQNKQQKNPCNLRTNPINKVYKILNYVLNEHTMYLTISIQSNKPQDLF